MCVLEQPNVSSNTEGQKDLSRRQSDRRRGLGRHRCDLKGPNVERHRRLELGLAWKDESEQEDLRIETRGRIETCAGLKGLGLEDLA